MKNIAFSKAWVIVFCSIAGLTSSSNAGERASGEDLEHRNYITDGVDRPLTIRNNAHWKIIAKDISSPIAVTCDHKQNVYIADDWKRCVYKFAPNGSKTIWWQGKGNQLPTRLAIDADDNLYVADKQGGTVHMVNVRAEDLILISGLNKPTDLTITSNGNLIVCEEGSNEIIEVPLRDLF